MAQDGEEDFFYQPQRARGQRLDPAIGRMAMAAGAAALVIIVITVIYSGFHGGAFGPPPVIQPPATPLRIAPTTPGGLIVPGADVPIMSGEMGSTGVPELAPQAAMPNIAQLDQAAGLNAVAPPESAPAPPASPAPEAAALAAAASVPLLAPAQSGGAEVQLAALADEGGAEAAWSSLQHKFPDFLGGKSPVIVPAVVNGNSIWRVRLGGFATAAAAQAFCTQLAAKGAGCMVVR